MTLQDQLENYGRMLNEIQADVNSLQLRVDKLETLLEELTPPVPSPLVRKAFPQGFPTVQSLVDAIETMFQCKNGHYRSYHTVQTEKGVETFSYVFLGAIASENIGNAQGQLRDLLYQTLHRLHGPHSTEPVTLYWRYAKQQRIEEDFENGRYKIRTRVAIPGAAYGLAGAMVPDSNDEGRFFELKEGSWPWPRKTEV